MGFRVWAILRDGWRPRCGVWLAIGVIMKAVGASLSAWRALLSPRGVGPSRPTQAGGIEPSIMGSAATAVAWPDQTAFSLAATALAGLGTWGVLLGIGWRDRRRREETPRLALDAVQKTLDIGLVVLDQDMRIRETADPTGRWFHHEDARGSKCYDQFTCADQPGEPCTFCPARQSLVDGAVHEKITDVTINGEHRVIRLTARPFRHGQTDTTSIVETIEDITRQRRMLEEREEVSAQLHLAMMGSRDGIWHWNLKDGSFLVSERWKVMLGLAPDEPIHSVEDWFERVLSSHLGRLHRELGQVFDRGVTVLEIELPLRHASGRTVWMLCHGVPVRDNGGRVVRLAGSLSDLSELRHSHEEIRRLSRHDGLTGLANHLAFRDRLETVLREFTGPSRIVGLIKLDLDGFKRVNAACGHEVGDQLLISTAQRIRQHTSKADIIARVGDDRFALLLLDASGRDQIVRAANQLSSVLSAPYELAGREVVCQASIGVGIGSTASDKLNADSLLATSRAALDEAKRQGAGHVVVASEEDYGQEARRTVSLQVDLHHALDRDQLHLVYQPIVDLTSGQVVCFEALLRWEHPEFGAIRPDIFIPMAERSGAIHAIGDWVFQEAARELKLLRSLSPEPERLRMAINLSRRQLLDVSLVSRLSHHAARIGVPPEAMELEITETAVTDDQVRLLQVLTSLREAGFGIAMDDFGTGYSSLGCLHQFPISTLKLDRSFVSALGVRVDVVAIVQAVVAMAASLNLSVVAEGIETEDELMKLQSLNCHLGQGWLFGKPASAEIARQLVITPPLDASQLDRRAG